MLGSCALCVVAIAGRLEVGCAEKGDDGAGDENAVEGLVCRDPFWARSPMIRWSSSDVTGAIDWLICPKVLSPFLKGLYLFSKFMVGGLKYGGGWPEPDCQHPSPSLERDARPRAYIRELHLPLVPPAFDTTNVDFTYKTEYNGSFGTGNPRVFSPE